MLNSALRCALAILLFRADTSDMPYDPGPALTRRCVVVFLATFALFCSQLLPPLTSILVAAMSALALGLITRAVLSLRKRESRFQQTFNALLLVNGLLNLAMFVPQWFMRPELIRVRDNPQILEQPEAIQLPLLPALLMFVLYVWQFAACARIYGQATDTNAFGGGLLTIVCFIGMMLFVMFASPVINLLGG